MASKRWVRFIDPWLEADLAGRARSIREVADATRRELEREGLNPDDRRVEVCQALGRDGTRLEGCLKFTLALSGHWRMVFVPVEVRDGEVYLCLAFGPGHPGEGEGPSAYLIADRRRHRS